MKWSLSQTAMIFSAVENSGRKRHRMAAGNEKNNLMIQDVKEAIQAKKDAFKALLQNRSTSDL